MKEDVVASGVKSNNCNGQNDHKYNGDELNQQYDDARFPALQALDAFGSLFIAYVFQNKNFNEQSNRSFDIYIPNGIKGENAGYFTFTLNVSHHQLQQIAQLLKQKTFFTNKRYSKSLVHLIIFRNEKFH